MARRVVALLGLIIFYFSPQFSAAEQLPIASFSGSGLKGWQTKIFSGATSYRLIEQNGQVVLLAESHNSASAIAKKMHVDLKKYPYLNWSWSIKNRLATTNEKIKSGDDYAARIYVVIDGGFLPWKTKAVNYVWATQALKEDMWPNAFAGQNVIMLALRNQHDATSTWYSEKRNVYEDLKKIFGTELRFIDAVALMTDTDNSHGQVNAYYGDIYFSSD